MAQFDSCLPGICGRSSAATPTTWNPSDKSAGATLSAGNLTFTGTLSNVGARSTNPLSTGKAYWEVLVVNDSGEIGGAFNIGFTDLGTTFAQMQSSGIIQMIFLFNGNVGNAGGLTFGGGVANGSTMCMAVDFGAKLSWFRINGGNWNASAPADPATATGGNTFAPAGPYYANAVSENGGIFTANFGATAFAFTKPTGFTSWNGLV